MALDTSEGGDMKVLLPISGLLLELDSTHRLAYSCRESWDAGAALTPVPRTTQVLELRTRRSPDASWLVVLGSVAGPAEVHLRCRRAIGWTTVPAYRLEAALWWAEAAFLPSSLQVVVNHSVVDVPLRGAGLPIAVPKRTASPAS
jgi:hypothetical protein